MIHKSFLDFFGGVAGASAGSAGLIRWSTTAVPAVGDGFGGVLLRRLAADGAEGAVAVSGAEVAVAASAATAAGTGSAVGGGMGISSAGFTWLAVSTGAGALAGGGALAGAGAGRGVGAAAAPVTVPQNGQ
jgi:hypothetical protein